ncbi:MAG: hypothetical protein LC667_04095 [Thioalkalivibrio sp.]|nr:hypothetical protein [Thioalkalivibrio sp.]
MRPSDRFTSIRMLVRAFGLSAVFVLLVTLVACGSPGIVPDPPPESAPTEPLPDETDGEDAQGDGENEEGTDAGTGGDEGDHDPVQLGDVAASIMLDSRVRIDWTVAGAQSIDIGCAADDEARSLATLSGDENSVAIPIPVRDCMVVRVTAFGSPDPVSVDVTLDNVVLHGGDTGPGSLRAVVAGAPKNAIVGFAADVVEVVLRTVDTSAAQNAHLVFARDVTVSGRSEDPVVLRSDPSLPVDPSGAPVLRSRIAYVPLDANVHLDALSLTGGGFVGTGGGLRNDGTLTLTRSVVSGNRAWYRGGGIVNYGSASLLDTELRENLALVTDAERSAPHLCTGDPDRTCTAGEPNYVAPLGEGGAGGGFYNFSGTAVLERTRLVSNRAVFSGGGAYVFDGSLELIDSNVRDNVASDVGTTIDSTSYGGGVAISGTGSATLRGGSVTDNFSANMGGGIGNGTGNAPDRPTLLDGVRVEGNHAEGYGGGAINYHTGEPGNLAETGSTDLSVNSAGVAGDGRFDSLVTAP